MKPVEVSAALMTFDGRLLIARRPAGKARAGWWEFPGGKVEAGESHEEALRREIFEELGFALTGPLTQVGRTSHRYEDIWVNLRGFTAELEPEEALYLISKSGIKLLFPDEIDKHQLTPPDIFLLEAYQQQHGK